MPIKEINHRIDTIPTTKLDIAIISVGSIATISRSLGIYNIFGAYLGHLALPYMIVKYSYKNPAAVAIAIVGNAGAERLQYKDIIGGTGDRIDVIAGTTGAILALCNKDNKTD